MTRWLLIALALSGCDYVFDLVEVKDIPPQVTGTFRYRTVVNDESFRPVQVEEILPIGSFALDAILDDGAEAPLVYREDGSFFFQVEHPGQAYRLRVSIDGLTGEYQHDAPHIDIGTLAAGHRDRRPVARSLVTFPYAPATVNRTATITSTGLYTNTDTGMAGATVTFDWRLASPAGGALPGMLDIADNDRIYAIEYETTTTGGSPAWSRYRAVSSKSITQAGGTVAMLDPLTVVTPNTCIHVQANAGAEKMRISNAHPRNYTENSGDWLAYATPAPDFVGMTGALYPAICGYANAMDLDIKPSFHDPYPGTTLVAEAATAQSFLVQLPPASSIPIANVTRVYAVATRADPASCNPEITNLEAHVGIPGAFKLDGVDLDYDGVPVTIDPARSPILSWDILADGPVDYSVISLQEVRAINNITTLIPRSATVVTGTSAVIDVSDLVADHTYIAVVQAWTGRPNAAAGDLMTIAPPFEVSAIWTHTFVAH